MRWRSSLPSAKFLDYALEWNRLPSVALRDRVKEHPLRFLVRHECFVSLGKQHGDSGTFRELGIWWTDALVWPLVLAAFGAALLWERSRASGGAPPAPEPETAAPALSPSRVTDLYRGVFGVLLVAQHAPGDAEYHAGPRLVAACVA